jgi:carotenoid cleavage dioxygenase-like enzyme
MSHSYYHSFGITENYFVFIEYPLIANTAVIYSIYIYLTILNVRCWNCELKMYNRSLRLISQKLLTMNLRQKAFDSSLDWTPNEHVEKHLY